jgi:hypothetical protein
MITLVTILGWITFTVLICILTWGVLGLLGLMLLYIVSKASRTPISIFGFGDVSKLELACKAMQFGPITLYFIGLLCYYHVRKECRTQQKSAHINQDELK